MRPHLYAAQVLILRCGVLGDLMIPKSFEEPHNHNHWGLLLESNIYIYKCGLHKSFTLRGKNQTRKPTEDKKATRISPMDVRVPGGLVVFKFWEFWRLTRS